MDITFWSLDFSEKHILPASGTSDGYVSMNSTIQFNGNGSFELMFNSKKIEEFAEYYKDGYFISWGDFQGYATDYQFVDKKRIFGSHLNAVLHRVVIPPYNTATKNINDVLAETIKAEAGSWIDIESLTDEELEGTKAAEYNSEVPMNGDKFIQEYLAAAGLGYQVYINGRKLHFKILKPQTTPLILSENNRNIYELQADFSNKNAAWRGWYKHTENDDGTKLEETEQQWTYIELIEKQGIYRRDVVLNSASPSKAKEELKQHKYELEFACKTRNVEYNKHYGLGDVVRLQRGNVTRKKQIASVDLWYEGCSYHTEPTLAEWEE